MFAYVPETLHKLKSSFMACLAEAACFSWPAVGADRIWSWWTLNGSCLPQPSRWLQFAASLGMDTFISGWNGHGRHQFVFVLRDQCLTRHGFLQLLADLFLLILPGFHTTNLLNSKWLCKLFRIEYRDFLGAVLWSLLILRWMTGSLLPLRRFIGAKVSRIAEHWALG